jgi:HB1, ASXL, restriction endonuclease HTH domain
MAAKKKNPAKTTSAKQTAKASRATKAEAAPPAEAGSQRLSALDAAAKVLAETGQPMRCTELIAAMAAKGYWTSPGGKTPASTLYSALLRELKTKKDQARFRKTERGKFGLA